MSLNEKNFVIIGKKATMNYVIACLTLFNSGAQNVTIKARGRSICLAIETVEMLRKAFIKDLEIKKIEIGSQDYNRLGKSRSISTIEITLSKPQQRRKTLLNPKSHQLSHLTSSNKPNHV